MVTACQIFLSQCYIYFEKVHVQLFLKSFYILRIKRFLEMVRGWDFCYFFIICFMTKVGYICWTFPFFSHTFHSSQLYKSVSVCVLSFVFICDVSLISSFFLFIHSSHMIFPHLCRFVVLFFLPLFGRFSHHHPNPNENSNSLKTTTQLAWSNKQTKKTNTCTKSNPPTRTLGPASGS